MDGDTNSNILDGSCAHNAGYLNDMSVLAWWQVDLQGDFDVSSVKIYNRMDCASCSSKI